jgi:hypothetical protein
MAFHASHSIYCGMHLPQGGDVRIKLPLTGGFGRILAALVMIWLLPVAAWGWSCKTHLFIAREAGIANPHTACYPDLAKKENDGLLGPYHWHNAAPDAKIDADYIDQFQVRDDFFVTSGSKESKPTKIRVPDPAGVLYWKIVEIYRTMKGSTGWEYEYYLSHIAHYVGDLSQPLHNFPYGRDPAGDGKPYPEAGAWAKRMHQDFDAALDPSLPLSGAEAGRFTAMVKPPAILSIDDLKKEIARVANTAISLANACYSEKRVIGRDEALNQAAMSVSLLKAIAESTRSR